MSGNPTSNPTPLNNGLTITCTSTPALNGVYATDQLTQDAMRCEIDSLLLNGNTFVDGSTTVAWPDKGGTSHTFTEAQFRELANALNLFIAQCFQYQKGSIPAAPATSATIS